jgi:hypothetical protein
MVSMGASEYNVTDAHRQVWVASGGKPRKPTKMV